MSRRLVPDVLWAAVQPLIPPFAPRAQGGGTAPVDARAVFTAIVYVLTSGSAWRQLPGWLEVDYRTAHRRFGQWSAAGLWRRVEAAVAGRFDAVGEAEWSRAILEAARLRAGESES